MRKRSTKFARCEESGGEKLSGRKFSPELGHEIPKEWKVVRLGDVAEIRRGKTVVDFDKVPFISMDLIPDSGIYVRYEIRKREEVRSFTYCERGDLLLAKITPCLENGKQGLVPYDLPYDFALATTEVFPIRCKDINQMFLFYILKFPRVRNVIISSMTGTTGRQRASRKSVENLKIPLPPLSEQRRIAEILSTVDEAIQRVGEAIRRTERLKRGLMQRLLTRGIGHQEFKFSRELGHEIPKEWKVVRLGDVCEINKESRDPAREMPDQEFLYVDIESIESSMGIIRQAKKILGKNAPSRARRVIRWNDVIMSTVRPYLKAFAIVPKEFDNQICSTGFAVLRCRKEILPRYLLYALFSNIVINQCNKMMVGGQYPALNESQVFRIKIPLPPLPEQRRIAEILGTVDKKLGLERKRKEKLNRIKRGLMNDLLTGRKRVKA